MTDLTKVVAGMGARKNLVQHEASAAADVRAGHLVEEVDAGVQPHGTAGGTVQNVLVAVDARGRGYEVGDTYETDPDGTVDDENVPYVNCNAGVELTMLLATGQTVAEGDLLASNGAGELRAYDSANDSDDAVVAKASEDLDTSGASDAAAVAVEVSR